MIKKADKKDAVCFIKYVDGKPIGLYASGRIYRYYA